MESAHVITSLHCYPIKSCRGIELETAVVERRGFAHDRRFMVVDADGMFRTQRKDPVLAQVDVSIVDGQLEISAAGHGSCRVALDQAHVGPQVTTTVWRHTGTSIDQGDDCATFFGDLLGTTSRLVHMADDEIRPVNPKSASSPEDMIGYADGHPLLVVCSASREALEIVAEEPVPMDRFRANIVLETSTPWIEDDWRSVAVNGTEFAFTRTCTRCVITTTDQRTGERHRQPLRALGKLRRTPDGVAFGTYFAPRSVGGTIHRGDALRVIG